ncbi:MAG: ATP-binding protein [Candidatus Hadarchaeales archaeon]
MEIEELKQVIETQRSELNNTFEKEQIIAREKLGYAKKFLKCPNILAVLGVRRCGKSIFSVLLAKEMGENFGYINFDDERLAGIGPKDLDKILQGFYELYGKVDFIILDEPQNVEKWELFANRLRRSKKVIITGSNSQLLSGELATALTGRHVDVLLSPFSFREALSFKPNIYLTEDIAKVRKELQMYIKGSGFPEYLKFGPRIVINIYEDIINKDCIRRYGIRNEKSFKELARYLVSNFSSEFTYSKLSKITGIKDVHTVKNYVDYMREAFLIHLLERFSFKLKQQIIAPKKAYVVDHGLANFIGFGLTKNLGRLYETIVCAELFNRLSETHTTEIYYYKDHQGREVDFVVKYGARVKQLIQVCYDLSDFNTKERELKSLTKAGKELGCTDLLVITDDFEGEEKFNGRKIKFLPLWKWLLWPATGKNGSPNFSSTESCLLRL